MITALNEIEFQYNDSTNAPCFRHYDRQSAGQSAYVEICGGSKSVYFSYNAEMGNAIPASVWNGYDIRFTIPNNVSAQQIEELIHDEDFQTLIKELQASFHKEYDGNKYVGKWNENLMCQVNTFLENTIRMDDGIEIASADIWLDEATRYKDAEGKNCQANIAVKCIVDGHAITADMTDAELKQVISELESTVESNQCIYDIDEYVEDIRSALQENN